MVSTRARAPGESAKCATHREQASRGWYHAMIGLYTAAAEASAFADVQAH